MFMSMGTQPLSTQIITMNLNGNNYPLNYQYLNSNNSSLSNNSLFSTFFGSENLSNLSTPFSFTNILQGLNNMGQFNFEDPVPVALTENALESIKEITFDEAKKYITDKNKEITDDETCSICFSLLSEDKDKYNYSVLPCDHIFHSQCIKPYLKDYDYHCPICRVSCGDHEAKIEI